MLKVILILSILLFPACGLTASINVLNNSGHAAVDINSAISLLGYGAQIGSGITTDETDCSSAFNRTEPAALVRDTSRNNLDIASRCIIAVNHAPYILLSNSFSGYSPSPAQDVSYYESFVSAGLLSNWAVISASTCKYIPLMTTGCDVVGGSYTTGAEFYMTQKYKGFDTNSPSGAAASFAGMLATIKYLKPAWNWFDIKGALRQTASNWSKGYQVSGDGFGNIDYDSAIAIRSASSIYLQQPLLTAIPFNGPGAHYVKLAVYPYRQMRRAYDVIYRFMVNPTFANNKGKNELTLADIQAIPGATLVYTSNVVRITPNTTYSPDQTGDFILRCFHCGRQWRVFSNRTVLYRTA